MLRSAKQININGNTMQNYDGLMIAPTVNLFGLLIDCKDPIDDKIKQFLSAHGVVIGRVKIDGELFVRITGRFKITKDDVDKFLIGNPDLRCSEVSEFNSDDRSRMKAHIQRTISKCKEEPRPVQFSNRHTTFSATRAVIMCKVATLSSQIDSMLAGVILSDNEDKTSSVSLSAGRNLTISGLTHDIQQEQSAPNAVKVGILADNHCLNNLVLAAGQSLVLNNALVDAAENLNINAAPNGEVQIYFEQDREWLNNPYPRLFQGYIKHKTGTFSRVPVPQETAGIHAEIQSSFSNNPSARLDS